MLGIKINNLTFEQQLVDWCSLRTKAESLPLEDALILINNFWLNPKKKWVSYYLDWDDQPKWPDPWQLLSDNVFCEVARGLGILYTLSMLNHPEIASAALVTTAEGYNLVLVNSGIYTLNWERDTVVNTHSATNIKRQLTLEQVKQQYN